MSTKKLQIIGSLGTNVEIDNMVQIDLDAAVEGGANTINANSLNGKTEDMLSVLRAVEAENAENAENTNTLGGKVESELSVANAVNANNANTLEGHSVNSLIDKIYPIGSIYMSVNSVSPATLFGGTWEALENRFLLGAGDTYAAGSTGGEATHTLTVAEMPSHAHDVIQASGGTGTSIVPNVHDAANLTINSYDAGTGFIPSGSSYIGKKSWGATIKSTGGSQPHNNMPPYLAVYMWKRTA